MGRTDRPLAARLGVVWAERRPHAVAAGALLALGGSFWGQRLLDRYPASPWAWAPLVVGAVALALLTRRQPLERVEPAAPLAARAPRLALLAPAVILGALAFGGFTGNRFRPWPTAAWLLALGLLFLSFRSPGPWRVWRSGAGREAAPAVGAHGVSLSWHAVALLAILVVAAALRLHQLDAIPREMGVDMPLKYANAQEIMQGQLMIFCPRYPGRESLYHYLLAAYGAVWGLSFFSIKFVSALCGLATVAALYGLACYEYDRWVALLAAALLAVSRWHVTLSRSGYRAAMMPLLVILVLWATARALRRGRATDFLLAGAAVGLGMYTYNAFMVVPPLLALAVAVALGLQGREAWRRSRWGLVALALGALGLFLPLGRYALEAPGTYLFRVATRVTSLEAPLPGDVVRVLGGNLWRAAAMFNLRGDGAFCINIPYQRQLGLVSGALFVCGLAYALGRWRQGHNATVVIFLGGLLLPTALAVAFPREVPNAIRASGALAPAYLLAALPLAAIGRRLSAAGLLAPQRLEAQLAWPGRWRWRTQASLRPGLALLCLLVALLVGLELGETWRGYFFDYVRHLPGRNYAISLELARTLDEFDPEGPSYIKVWPHWFDGHALRAQLRVKAPTWDWELEELDPGAPPLSTVQGKALFIVHPADEQALHTLRACFPRGVAVSHRDYEGRVAFVTFYAER